MKFIIASRDKPLDIGVVERALIEVDPAAMLDLDKTNSSLRVSSCLDDAQLLALIQNAGFPIVASDISGVPSDCCGGCGG